MKIAMALLLAVLVGCSATKAPSSNSPPAQQCNPIVISVRDTVYFPYPMHDTVYVRKTDNARAVNSIQERIVDTVYIRGHDTVYVSQPAVTKKELVSCHEVTDVYQMCEAFMYNKWYKHLPVPADPIYTTDRDTLDTVIRELNRVCPQKAKLTHYDYPVDLTPEDYVIWLRRLGIPVSKRFERIVVNREAGDYAEFLIGGIVVRYQCVPD